MRNGGRSSYDVIPRGCDTNLGRHHVEPDRLSRSIAAQAYAMEAIRPMLSGRSLLRCCPGQTIEEGVGAGSGVRYSTRSTMCSGRAAPGAFCRTASHCGALSIVGLASCATLMGSKI